jgi:hypothetical protein
MFLMASLGVAGHAFAERGEVTPSGTADAGPPPSPMPKPAPKPTPTPDAGTKAPR